ncbi:MAG: YggS family pyridoxal phosphate-dependent enzyme [Spirochaetaceae bacterium]|nr:YggS family pyridoxal phosphate-dependent enzyme [Spirochaetaceae bacterium]
MKKVLEELHNQIKELSPVARLMAVSKTHPYCAIEEAYGLGERLFGENKVQEVESKFPKMEDRASDMDVHLIGHLQSNKVKKAVTLVNSIDSVDSLKLLRQINKRAQEANIVMNVLLEYNTSGDENKSGFDSYTSIKEALIESKNMENICVNGLMTLGPLAVSENETKASFNLLKDISIRLVDETGVKLKELSMGMSGDYKIALECESTIIRVGTKIFGHRDYSKK